MKTYCLDTSVFLDNPKVIETLGDSEIIIPFCVVSELDGKRHNEGKIGQNARETIRILDALSQAGSLLDGVKTEGGALVRVHLTETPAPTNDLKIVETAKEVATAKKRKKKVIILSNDLGLRVHASGMGIECHGVRDVDQDSLYSGVVKLDVDSGLINKMYERKFCSLSDLTMADMDFYPNQMVILNCQSQGALGRVKNDQLHLVEKRSLWGLQPTSAEQIMAANLLTDPSVHLVSLLGRAGSGKTLLSIAAGLEQVLEQGLYEKIIIIRPIVSVGKELGFLPGTIEEKMEPWIQPIKDNLSVLFKGNKRAIDMYFEDGTFVVEAVSFIRGRSIPKSFIIIDEAQNMSKMEIKTVLTRAAQGSKIVVTGDVEQIDNRSSDISSNGLAHAVDKFKHYAISGHVTLQKGFRSELSSLAAEIL